MSTALLPQLLAELAAVASKEAGGVGYKHDATGTPATIGYVHGPGGWLTYPGVDPDVFSTVVGFQPSLLSIVPAQGSVYNSPVYQVLTSIGADSGAEPTTVCGPAPIGGVMAGGKVTAPFGLYKRQTRELNIARMGLRNDRADPTDVRLLGNPTGGTPWTDPGFNQGSILTNDLDTALFERAVAFHRLLSRQVWTGNPSNNVYTATGTAYAEMAGLEKLINTGYRDAETGSALPSLDPYIRDFGKRRIDDGTNGAGLVNEVTYMVRNLKLLAETTGLDPVRWALFMRQGLFYELTKVWPCSYFTTVCNIPGTGAYQQVVDNGDIIAMRDRMRTGSFLIVDGVEVPVITDGGITEYTSANLSGISRGCFNSDIFYLPLSVLGGRRTIYLEYFEYTNPSINSVLGTGMFIGRTFSNGAFFETMDQTNGCFYLQAQIAPRLVVRTPWLAGRITNVQYCPLQHQRDPFPTDPYFVGGGQTTRQGPSLYNPVA